MTSFFINKSLEHFNKSMKSYKQFIIEAEDAIQKISSSWERRHPGMKFHLERSRSGNIRLAKIEVPKEKRGTGIGTRALRGLTRYADKSGSTISLTPEPERGYKEKLNRMYSSHGFVKNQGKNKDYSISDAMIRTPRQ